MKTNFTRIVLFFTTNILLSLVLAAQSGADYRFENPTLISGTDKQVGATYRFPTVKSGLDALVQVSNITPGVSLNKIDRTADGYSEAFQPEVKLSGLTNGYVEFTITFVTANTITPVIQNSVDVSALDIDGQTNGLGILFEYNRVDMGGGIYDFHNTSSQLVISKSGTAYTALNITGVLFGASVDTAAHDNMFTVMSSNISSFTYRAGANNGMTGSSTRYSSLYFKKFNYQNVAALALPKIENFQGNSNGQQVSLKWKMGQSDDLANCILERAEKGNDFKQIASFSPAKYSAFDNQFTDNLTNAGNFYYRLKLIDVSGEIKYSNVLAFKLGEAASARSLKVYPTLITSQFTAKINSSKNETGMLQMTDLSGRIVYQKQINLQAGTNNICVSDLETHSKGNYVVVFRSADNLISQKIAIL